MEEHELEQKYEDIFSNLSDYVLFGSPESLMILKVSTMGFCLIEEDYDEIISLMEKRGAKIVDHIEDVRPKDFEPFHNIWDEELKLIRRVSQSELDQILEERAKKKGKSNI